MSCLKIIRDLFSPNLKNWFFTLIKHKFFRSFEYIFVSVFCLLTGCSQGDSTINDWMRPDGKIKILSTTAIIDDIVGKIGQNRISHLSLITGEIDPHSYELVKGDDEKINRATLVFCHGLGLEHGASLRSKLDRRNGVIDLGHFIKEKNPASILTINKQVDPHIWMDVLLWSDVIDPIVEELSKQDPEGASFYRQNGEKLRGEMLDLHEKIITQMNEIPSEKKYLVTSHDAFNYFTKRYIAQGDEGWAVYAKAPEGLAPDGQLSCFDIQQIVDHLCKYHIQVVFPESNVSQDSLKKIMSACLEKGLDVRIAGNHLHADALGPSGSDADTYLKMMEHNVSLLIHEWQ